MQFAPAVLTAACVFAILPASAHAQRVPFFGGAGTAFDPEVSVVNSGALLDAQVVVSHDRKYVTINARPSNAQLLALREFTFQGAINTRMGFVGGAAANGAAGAGVLGRRGMSLVADLDG